MAMSHVTGCIPPHTAVSIEGPAATTRIPAGTVAKIRDYYDHHRDVIHATAGVAALLTLGTWCLTAVFATGGTEHADAMPLSRLPYGPFREAPRYFRHVAIPANATGERTCVPPPLHRAWLTPDGTCQTGPIPVVKGTVNPLTHWLKVVDMDGAFENYFWRGVALRHANMRCAEDTPFRPFGGSDCAAYALGNPIGYGDGYPGPISCEDSKWYATLMHNGSPLAALDRACPRGKQAVAASIAPGEDLHWAKITGYNRKNRTVDLEMASGVTGVVQFTLPVNKRGTPKSFTWPVGIDVYNRAGTLVNVLRVPTYETCQFFCVETGVHAEQFYRWREGRFASMMDRTAGEQLALVQSRAACAHAAELSNVVDALRSDALQNAARISRSHHMEEQARRLEAIARQKEMLVRQYKRPRSNRRAMHG